MGVLIDAGLPCRRLAALLGRIGRTLGDVDAVLLTHDHADHTSGVESLVREKAVRVFAAPGVDHRAAALVAPGETFEVGELSATFFEVPHDSATYGVRLSGGDAHAALATDLGECSEGVLRWLRGAEAVVLEANHDIEWLRRGPYPARLKRRIASPNGHLSNEQAAEVAVALASHGLKDLVLAHLSKTNNSAARACGTVHGALRRAGFEGVRVRAAIAGHPTPYVEVGAPVEHPGYVYRYGDAAGGGGLFQVE